MKAYQIYSHFDDFEFKIGKPITCGITVSCIVDELNNESEFRTYSIEAVEIEDPIEDVTKKLNEALEIIKKLV